MSIDADKNGLIPPRFTNSDQWVALLRERNEVQLDGIFSASDLRDIIAWLEATRREPLMMRGTHLIRDGAE
jgi:hypothetical protein